MRGVEPKAMPEAGGYQIWGGLVADEKILLGCQPPYYMLDVLISVDTLGKC